MPCLVILALFLFARASAQSCEKYEISKTLSVDQTLDFSRETPACFNASGFSHLDLHFLVSEPTSTEIALAYLDQSCSVVQGHVYYNPGNLTNEKMAVALDISRIDPEIRQRLAYVRLSNISTQGLALKSAEFGCPPATPSLDLKFKVVAPYIKVLNGCLYSKAIALTFDVIIPFLQSIVTPQDGPTNIKKIASYLSKLNVTATFFVNGLNYRSVSFF